jgi:hypothetical protein
MALVIPSVEPAQRKPSGLPPVPTATGSLSSRGSSPAIPSVLSGKSMGARPSTAMIPIANAMGRLKPVDPFTAMAKGMTEGMARQQAQAADDAKDEAAREARRQAGADLLAQFPDQLAIARQVMTDQIDASTGFKLASEATAMAREQADESAWIENAAAYAESQGRPDVAEGIRAEVITRSQIMGAMNPNASDETFYGTPVPFVREDETIGVGQMGNKGSFREVKMPGAVAPTTKQIDAGNVIITTDVYGNELYRTPKNGSVPTGYQQGPGGAISPMAGGEADRELREAALQKEQRAQAADQRADLIIGAIDTAGKQAGWWTTGMAGNIGRGFGAGPAVDLQKTIDTIRANIGFSELQQMRELSPTGGALGGIAIQELEMLQSVLGSLDPSQGEDQLRQNLETIKTLLERQKEYRAAALEESKASAGTAAIPSPTDPAGGSTYDYATKYGLEQ